MKNYRAEIYGERIADTYDDWYSSPGESSIELLSDLANGGRVLELGIGTGRVALPLKEKGIDIHGIDASPAMIGKLRAKPYGNDIPITFGDFSEVPVEGKFDLIFVVFNTFFSLTTQETQLKCLQNVAKHLTMKGKFLIEAFVPDPGRFDRGQSVRATEIGENQVKIDVSKHNQLTQQITGQHVLLTDGGVRLFPVTIRYTWPSELDMMARVAGMKLIDRWGDWNQVSFSSDSIKHISVYKPLQKQTHRKG
ncbi:MAG: class I SAM-dependent methyltransferase [Candidatus Sabulitectum sp.]|nr:class I SAM-dependent methyltransferase [Candidatus Sabulitectum sp.]